MKTRCPTASRSMSAKKKILGSDAGRHRTFELQSSAMIDKKIVSSSKIVKKPHMPKMETLIYDAVTANTQRRERERERERGGVGVGDRQTDRQKQRGRPTQGQRMKTSV